MRRKMDVWKLASFALSALGFGLALISDAVAEKREQEWIKDEVQFQLGEAAQALLEQNDDEES